jgi:DNA-binding transcriptional MerR regulator
MDGRGHTVGRVAQLSGVSVRTLHHYDEIGLLRPQRTDADYRLYSDADLARLRRILFYRELDFALEDIAALLDDDDADAGTDKHLRRQHRELRARQTRTEQLLAAIEHEMEARQMGIDLTPEEQLEIFGTDRMDALQAEARQTWGDSAAWAESQRRTRSHTKDDWVQIKDEAAANIAAFAQAIAQGEPADGATAMDLAEDHRRHLTRWFYDCGHAQHRGLGDLYVADPRYYDDIAPGFSQYVCDAIHANAARAGH